MNNRLLTDRDMDAIEGEQWRMAPYVEEDLRKGISEAQDAKTAYEVYKEVGEWLNKKLIYPDKNSMTQFRAYALVKSPEVDRLLAGLPPEQEGREE